MTATDLRPEVLLDRCGGRFAIKVRINPETGCWQWTACLSRAGYGRFHVAGQSPAMAHRYAYEVLVGPIPIGLQLDHLCRVRRCVNPAHLEPVTVRENLLRGDTITAARAAQTHCGSGHALSPDNTYIKPNGCRNCRECKRAADRRYKAAQR